MAPRGSVIAVGVRCFSAASFFFLDRSHAQEKPKRRSSAALQSAGLIDDAHGQKPGVQIVAAVELAGVGLWFVEEHDGSLPVASGAITMTWKIAGVLHPQLSTRPHSAWFPVILSIIVGVAFYLASDTQPGAIRQKLPSILPAFFNTVTLAASVLGLSEAIKAGGGG